MSARLPGDVQRLISEAERAETVGDTSRALKCYNDAIAAAMGQHLDAMPELRPVLEQYLLRALELQPKTSHTNAGFEKHRPSNSTNDNEGDSTGAGTSPDRRAMASAAAICVGDRCVVTGRAESAGTVLFVGETDLGPDIWAGIALDSPTGTHDGFVKGTRYFCCRRDHGLMVKATRVQRVVATDGSAAVLGTVNDSKVNRASSTSPKRHRHRSPPVFNSIQNLTQTGSRARIQRDSHGNNATKMQFQSTISIHEMAGSPHRGACEHSPGASTENSCTDAYAADSFPRSHLHAAMSELQAENNALVEQRDSLLHKLQELEVGQSALQHDASAFRKKLLRAVDTAVSERDALAQIVREKDRAHAPVERRNERLEDELKRARGEAQRLTAELAKVQQIDRVARNLHRQGYNSPVGQNSEVASREAELEEKVAELQNKLEAEKAWALQWKGECSAVREELRTLLQGKQQQVAAAVVASYGTPPRKENG
eukprot:SAG31_NODE_942_length_10853_cov_24.620420_9_plen_485_part_00